ncbi:DUF2771 domain-containing protein [Streptomyces sp. A3M-1-3]|uniref:DUF2771 domain-containing protein n=1 Tax=Streptomyces sp. A3M-1-3 TaxID=2962044 RepID=UPI0020B7A73A|nr:DUF2771 domain-containing protein [Streptomyces sp. A3M-1-3]MCP3822001.1 DUF2771 domain-containing protein [Streptomyces sp. A3M-1-3]
MTAPLFSGKGRRTAAALGAVSAGLLVLSACGSKPTPLATVTVGTTTVTSEAACQGGDGKGLSNEKLQECIEGLKTSKTVKYSPGTTLRIGVEPEVVEDGKKWIAALDGQPITDQSNKTYRSFPGVDFFGTGGQGEPAKSRKISIIQFSDKGPSKGKAEAVWNFKLQRDDS